MYNETVLRHYREARNVGEIENAHGVGIYMSDFCGGHNQGLDKGRRSQDNRCKIQDSRMCSFDSMRQRTHRTYPP